MNVLKAIGRNIKFYRTQAGLSQERLAEMAKLHRTYIGAVERGERNVSAINIAKIAHALKVIQPLSLSEPLALCQLAPLVSRYDAHGAGG
jgi:transcriptional regulator with XRE-family HTH domain